MMKYCMVSVYDRASMMFGVPQFCATPAQALRGFKDQVNDKGNPQNVVAAHPDDFDLYELGEWHDGDGSFVSCSEAVDDAAPVDKPRLIARGKDLVNPV